MKEYKTKRQLKDHERYLRQREERLLRQRLYYQQHREEILKKNRSGKDRYIRRDYE